MRPASLNIVTQYTNTLRVTLIKIILHLSISSLSLNDNHLVVDGSSKYTSLLFSSGICQNK